MASDPKPVGTGSVQFTFASSPRVEAVKKRVDDKKRSVDDLWKKAAANIFTSPPPTPANKDRYQVKGNK